MPSGEVQSVDPVIEKNIGTIVPVIMAAITAAYGWSLRLSGRIRNVEDKASTNQADIRHMRGDLTELKEATRTNHAETVRMIERVFDKIDTIKGKP